MKFEDINMDTAEGIRLIAAMAIISQTDEYSRRTPQEIMAEIEKRTSGRSRKVQNESV